MRSPVFTMLWAMLWENWRLTRVEVAWRLALGIVGGTAVPGRVLFPTRGHQGLQRSNRPHPHRPAALRGVAVDGEAQWRAARLSALSPLHPSGSDVGTRRRSDGVPHRVAVGDIPRVGASPEGDLGLRVPAGARRGVDRGPQPGPGGDELVDPQQVDPDAGSDDCHLGLAASGHASPYSSGDPGRLRLAPASVADAVRLPAHRLRADRRDWPGVVRSDGRRGGTPAPRRRTGGHSLDSRRWILGLARQPVPIPVSHRVCDARAGLVRPEVRRAAAADDRSGARDRESAAVRGQRSHRCVALRGLLRPTVRDAFCNELRAGHAGLRGQCLRYSRETGTFVRQRVRGRPAVRNRTAGLPQSTAYGRPACWPRSSRSA